MNDANYTSRMKLLCLIQLLAILLSGIATALLIAKGSMVAIATGVTFCISFFCLWVMLKMY